MEVHKNGISNDKWFCKLSFNEMEKVDGGFLVALGVFGLGLLAGYVVTVVVDGELKENTEKTGTERYQEWRYPTTATFTSGGGSSGSGGSF